MGTFAAVRVVLLLLVVIDMWVRLQLSVFVPLLVVVEMWVRLWLSVLCSDQFISRDPWHLHDDAVGRSYVGHTCLVYSTPFGIVVYSTANRNTATLWRTAHVWRPSSSICTHARVIKKRVTTTNRKIPCTNTYNI